MTRIPCISIRRGGPLGELIPDGELPAMPRTRSECENGPRPCPHLACRHHLMLDVKPNGTIRVNFTDLDDMEETCSLDASTTSRTLDDIGRLLGNVTKKSIQVDRDRGLEKLRKLGVV